MAHSTVHCHLQPVWFRAGELNQKQWVQDAPIDALWDRLRGLHDHQGRTCLVHTVHWHTSAPHTSQTARSTDTVTTDCELLSIQHQQKISTCMHFFTLSHWSACLTKSGWRALQLTLGLPHCYFIATFTNVCCT